MSIGSMFFRSALASHPQSLLNHGVAEILQLAGNDGTISSPYAYEHIMKKLYNFYYSSS